jgi:hypothetical protein
VGQQDALLAHARAVMRGSYRTSGGTASHFAANDEVLEDDFDHQQKRRQASTFLFNICR